MQCNSDETSQPDEAIDCTAALQARDMKRDVPWRHSVGRSCNSDARVHGPCTLGRPVTPVRPISTTRVNGPSWRVSKNAPEFSGRQLGPWTRAVNSGSGNRPLVSIVYCTNQTKRLMKKTKKKTIEQASVRKGSPMEEVGVYGGKDLRKRYLLSLEWKRVGVTMTVLWWWDRTDELRQFGCEEWEIEWSGLGWRNEAGSLFQRQGDAYN